MNRIIVALYLLLTANLIFAQDELINFWGDNIPNYQESNSQEFVPPRDIVFIKNVQKPTLEVFMPSKQNASGMAVLICPGGGYGGVAYDWEGADYAKWFNAQGIAAFVLKYRMPQAESVLESHKAPIQDAQRAMRYIRSRATEFNIESNKVGVIGSSAGGHLASTLGTHLRKEYYKSVDSVDVESYIPNFMMLIYPVISMKEGITHQGSRNNLLGINPSNELVLAFSNELHVTENTPPTFIIHSGNDKAVPVDNSILMYQALVKNKVKTTMHIYPEGGHGYSMGINNDNAPNWTNLAENWLKLVLE